MNDKPIGPTAHDVIDYGFVTVRILAPSLFGLKGTSRALCYAFAGTQGVINVLTDHPVGLRCVIPLWVHGQLETPFVPALLVLPMLTGAFKQRSARRYFLSFFGTALANYLLTDYRAYERAPLLGSAERGRSSSKP